MSTEEGIGEECGEESEDAEGGGNEEEEQVALASSFSVESEEEYGVSFRKGSDLTDAFNDFMITLKDEGILQDLAAKYNLTLAG